jgi:serine/threonine protein kinase
VCSQSGNIHTRTLSQPPRVRLLLPSPPAARVHTRLLATHARLRFVTENGRQTASSKASGAVGTSAAKPGPEDRFNKRYELGKVLGKGNYSVVRLAKDREEKGREVAVKCMTRSELTQEDKDALLVEVGVLFELKHPNVIELYAWFESPKMYWLATELMPGGELFDRIVSKQFYKERDAQSVVLTLAGVLAYLHDRGIVHRDLKPENILLKSKSDDAALKIADFGFVARVKPQGLSTTCGTPAYVAPEIVSGKLYGTSVDMWSFGVIV